MKSSTRLLLLLGALFALGAVSLKTASESGASKRAGRWKPELKASAHCKDLFWSTLKQCVTPLNDNTTFVLTGDIQDMFTRDSSAQMMPYIAIAQQELEATGQSMLLPLLEGTLRRQAKYILTDPYANSFSLNWTKEQGPQSQQQRLSRGAYVSTGNYELDNGAYFWQFLDRLSTAFPTSPLVNEKPIKDATAMLLALYRQEQNHAKNKSEYLYPRWAPMELPNSDLLVNYTGMIWGAFRPSDDPQTYGYNIPVNLFMAESLKSVARIANESWDDAEMSAKASSLSDSIIEGVHNFGTKRLANGKEVYCYEVDGFGDCNLMDDANVPSLLSLPYVDPSWTIFNETIYKATREFILSERNPWFFKGNDGEGIGSPHTGRGMVWPLALVMQAMTAETQEEKERIMRTLTHTHSLKESLTESFSVANSNVITRKWFSWPNALFSELLMSDGICYPDVKEIEKMIPPTKAAPVKNFYTSNPAEMRRTKVTLPKPEFY